MASELCVQLLGEFDATHGGERLDTLTSPRLQSLLAYLLLHRGVPQSRQHVAFLFWPDSTDSQARTNLRKALYDLRQALPEADTFVDADDHTIRWRVDAPLVLDVAAFEEALAEAQAAEGKDLAETRQALERAVDLYEGDLLPGCYEDWIVPERERLHARHLGALEQLAELHEQARDVRAAIETAQRLLRHDPLHEPAYRRLMRLHAAQGDRAGALHVYHTCVTVLERELGVEPGEATQRAHQRLLETEAAPLAADAAPLEAGVVTEAAAAPEPEAAPLPGLVASVPLVGRHPEWAQLVATWQQAARGESHALLVEGEAGIGKSRLAGELARWLARQGVRTAAARCYAAEGALPYAPVVAWLRVLPLPALEPAWMSELARMLPELLHQHPELPPPGPMTEPWQRQRLFEALARAVLGTAQPLLLILDDLQWSDADTRAWLHYLLRYDPQAPLLLLGTVRSEELDAEHPLLAWTRSLHHDGKVTEVELARLDEEDTLDLATHVAEQDLSPELATCMYAETQGNPLFVIEMVRAGLAVGELEPACELRALPPRIQGAIEARLGQLSQQGRALTEVAAVVGRGFSLELLLAATSMEEDAAIVALDELWQRRVVVEQSEAAYDFSHDKLREVAYAGLSPVRRRLLHGRLASALEALHGNDLDPVAEEIAVHHDRAGQPTQAIPYYLRAGKVARRVYANHEAMADYERVLELVPLVPEEERSAWRLEALAGLGETCLWVGDVGRGEELLQEAIALSQRISVDPHRLAAVYYALARAYGVHYRYAEQAQTAETALAFLGEGDQSVEAALVSGAAVMAYSGLAGQRTRWRELMLRVASDLERLPYVEGLGPVYERVFDLHLRARDLTEATRWLQVLQERATVAGDREAQAIAEHRMGRILDNEGDLHAAIPHYQQAVEITRQIGNVSLLPYRLFWLAYRLLSLGQILEAERHARAGVDATTQIGVPVRVAWQYWCLGLTLLCRDASDEAVDALERAVDLTDMDRQPETALLAHCLLGNAHLRAGQRESALQHLELAAELATPKILATWHAPDIQPYGVFLVHVLSALERAHADTASFRAHCRSLAARGVLTDGAAHSPELAQLALQQWFLEPADPDLSLQRQDVGGPTPSDARPPRSVAAEWAWIDPRGDCSDVLDDGLEIRAALGRDLWHVNWSAPRLLRNIPSVHRAGFVLQAICCAAREDRPAMGGLLLWANRDHYLRLDWGSGGPHEITLLGCMDGQDVLLGRGRLPPKSEGADETTGRPEQAYLRFEYADGLAKALCSVDSVQWYTAGQSPFALTEDAQCGVYAIGNIDRTVYSGAYAEGTAIRFTSVQVWGG